MSWYKWAVVVAGSVVGLPGSAAAVTYNCLPIQLLEEAALSRVLCAAPSGLEGGYPRDGADRVDSFAVPSSDVDFAKRFVLMMQTAITAGMVVQFQYTTGDIGGCPSNNCRRPWAFGLLAPATEVRVPYAEWPSGSTESISSGEWKRYGPFSISQFRKLVVTMSGTASADLYVRRDDPPDSTNFNCRPKLPGANESCTMAPVIPDPANPTGPPMPIPATYFVGVRGGGSGSFQLTVSIQPR